MKGPTPAEREDVTYTDVVGASDEAECRELFERLLVQVADKFGGTPESNREQQLSNVGYFTGYYDAETACRVQHWLNCSHPIFGKSRPTAAEAFEAGQSAGEESPDA